MYRYHTGVQVGSSLNQSLNQHEALVLITAIFYFLLGSSPARRLPHSTCFFGPAFQDSEADLSLVRRGGETNVEGPKAIVRGVNSDSRQTCAGVVE